MSVRGSFVARFGEEQTQAVIEAASMHNEQRGQFSTLRLGTDSFKDIIAIVLGYQCVEKSPYREDHGITIPWNEFDDWVMNEANMATHERWRLDALANDKYIKK